MPTLKVNERGVLIVDGVQISGIVESYDIGGAMRVQRQASDDTSGKTAVFNGYDDMNLTLKITLFSSKRYQAVQILNEAFKKLVGDVPVVYTLDFPLARSMNYKTALLKNITIGQSKMGETIQATVVLEETDPVIKEVQTQRQKKVKQEKESGAVVSNEVALTTEEDKTLLERARGTYGYT